MNVRGVEIEVVRAAPTDVAAKLVVTEQEAAAAAGTRPDEHSLRAACAGILESAKLRGASSLALPPLGIDAGMSPVTSGKIMVQEIIRAARSGASGLTRIVLCCPGEKDFALFSKTVNGYLRHFIDVLIWGPFVTVDAIIEVPGGLVLIRRSNPPLGHALPGGFVDYGERLEDAVRREAREETGLELVDLAQFHTYSDPARDPRFHTITTVFSARASGTPRAGDDAADVLVVRPQEIDGIVFAFDHQQVVRDWLARGREP
jgi:8-oxo-dGTP diphosphatase